MSQRIRVGILETTCPHYNISYIYPTGFTHIPIDKWLISSPASKEICLQTSAFGIGSNLAVLKYERKISNE